MKIDFVTKTIEVSKAFATKASHFGSMEYKELRAVINELPNFRVMIKAAPTSHQTYTKGLTYEFMEQYISRVSEDESVMQDFLYLRQGCSYNEIKKWFFAKFPEINYFAA